MNSCFDWCDYHLVMVCQFCDVTFVYGESLQWGFGFYLLFLIGCVIGSREEHLCLVHVLFWSIRCLVSDVDQMDIRIVELHRTLVSEVDLVCDPLVVVWVFIRFWFLKWTLIWDVGVQQTFVSEVDPLFFVDIGWDLSEFCFWSGSCWCRRQNLLLLIRFQHEGVCEAWSFGSWLPWWTI